MQKEKAFTPQKVYEYFQKKYPLLKNVKLRPITSKMGSIYHGATQLKPVDDKDYEYVGKIRQRQVLPEFIMLNLKQENATFVLLHQIAHCFAPEVEQKREGEWVKEDHSRVFYDKFWQVVKQANEAGIYLKKFDNLQHLMRFDKSV